MKSQMDELTIPFLGPGAGDLAVPVPVAAAAGATAGDGLRLGVSTADPLLEMEVAVDARSATSTAASGRRSCPMSGSTSTTPWRRFTAGQAWVNHLEADLGSIEVGKTADLAVLDRDLFDRGAGAIGEARVVATFIDGESPSTRRPRSTADGRRRRSWTHDDVDLAPDDGVAARPRGAMLWHAPRNRSGAAERRDPVNAVAIMYVNSHLIELQGEAQRNRTASLVAKRSLRQRVASATASLSPSSGRAPAPSSRASRTIPYGG